MNAKLTEQICAFPYIIWDLDGPILDSMRYWSSLGRDYLTANGISPPADLEKTIESMTLEESASYFQNEFGMHFSEQEIISGVLEMIADEYRTVIPAKETAARLIRTASERGCRMCVLTTSDRELTEAALRRTELLECFEAVLTSGDLGMDKRSAGIYKAAMKKLGYNPEKTLICEDALYAVRGASGSGAKVMAFRDETNAAEWDRIRELADFTD